MVQSGLSWFYRWVGEVHSVLDEVLVEEAKERWLLKRQS